MSCRRKARLELDNCVLGPVVLDDLGRLGERCERLQQRASSPWGSNQGLVSGRSQERNRKGMRAHNVQPWVEGRAQVHGGYKNSFSSGKQER